MTTHDLIIIGAGSSGYPAGMYRSRYNIKNIIIGGEDGGDLATSHRVENWPGVISAPGSDITNAFKEHRVSSGSEILHEFVDSLELDGDIFKVKTNLGKDFSSKYVLLATGNSYKHLGVPGEEDFLGKGVSYCATCDGTFFKGMDVAMVGGGNTRLSNALYLADIVNKVYIVHRRDEFRREDVWVDLAHKKDNIEFVLNEEVESIEGSIMGVEQLKLKSGKSLNVAGVFIAIGSYPNTTLVDDFDIPKDEEGCLVVDKRQATNIPGLYRAGDVTTNSNKFRQTIMGAAEGCLARDSIHNDMMRNR